MDMLIAVVLGGLGLTLLIAGSRGKAPNVLGVLEGGAGLAGLGGGGGQVVDGHGSVGSETGGQLTPNTGGKGGPVHVANAAPSLKGTAKSHGLV